MIFLATRHIDAVAGDIDTFLRGKERAGIRRIFWQAHPAHRNARFKLLQIIFHAQTAALSKEFILP